MKKLILILLPFFIMQVNFAQSVTVPDANFRAFLKLVSPDCFDSSDKLDVQCAREYDFDGFLPEISLVAKDYKTIDGIQYYDNLDVLLVGYSGLEEIPALPINLKELWVYGNELDALPELPLSLEILVFSDNNIGEMPDLHEGILRVDASSNPIEVVPPLVASLEDLDVSSTEVSELPELPVNLKVLDCGQNIIQNLPTLPKNLETLKCGSNRLGSIPTLPEKLKHLDISYNSIGSIPALPPTIETLDVSNIGMSEVNQPLPNTLRSLDVANNSNLEHLPETLADSLRYLWCQGTKISELPKLPSELIILNVLDNDSLTCLPLLPETLRDLLTIETGITCKSNTPANLDYEDVALPICLEEHVCQDILGLGELYLIGKELVKIIDLQGREVGLSNSGRIVIYQYSDGSTVRVLDSQ